jgi:hypothetical protein
MLHTLKDRWWKQKRGGGACSDDSKKGSAVNELSLANVGGVFVVLLGGLAFSILMALCEFMWRARKITSTSADEASKSMCNEMVKDIKFALSCQSSTKSVVRPNDNLPNRMMGSAPGSVIMRGGYPEDYDDFNRHHLPNCNVVKNQGWLRRGVSVETNDDNEEEDDSTSMMVTKRPTMTAKRPQLQQQISFTGSQKSAGKSSLHSQNRI